VKVVDISGGGEYLKVKINGLETNSNNKTIGDLDRVINDFKKGYLSITNTVNHEKSALVADPHSILDR
jgi:hypothetical protein